MGIRRPLLNSSVAVLDHEASLAGIVSLAQDKLVGQKLDKIAGP